MKKLSSYIITLYILFTVVPLTILIAVTTINDVIQEKNRQEERFNKVLNQQLIDAEKSLIQFDLQLADNVVTQLAQLSFITSVKLNSHIYDMTLAEVINHSKNEASQNVKKYTIYKGLNQEIGVLYLTKNDNAYMNSIILSLLPRSIFLIIIIGLFGFAFSHKIISTLKRPFIDVQRYAYLVANGNFDMTPPSYKFDEINALFSSLDNMRYRLLTNITELRKSEEKYSKTYNLTQVGLFVVNVKEKQIVHANQAFLSLFGDLDFVNNKENLEKRVQFIQQLIKVNSQTGFEYSLFIKNARRFFKVNCSVNSANEIECSALDITDVVKTKKKIEKQLITDSLTQIPNRVAFMDFVKQAKSKEIKDFSVMMLDLDGFKNVNDTYGHSAGDILLTTIAKRLSDEVKYIGKVFRLGGDEFTITLEGNQKKEDLHTIAQTIVHEVEQDILFNGERLSVSVSIGIHTCSNHDNVSDVLHNADLAMYHAKENKSRVMFADDLLLITE